MAAALELFADAGVRGDVRRADRPGRGHLALDVLPAVRRQGRRRLRRSRAAARPSCATQLSRPHDNPWVAVCEASVWVYRQFTADPELARRRYAVVREVPVLREREIVTVFRYERLFDDYLRGALPGLDPLDAVGFAALVTAVHNHVLRQLLRGTKRVPVSVLRHALDDVLRRFGVHPDGDAARRGRRRRGRLPETDAGGRGHASPQRPARLSRISRADHRVLRGAPCPVTQVTAGRTRCRPDRAAGSRSSGHGPQSWSTRRTTSAPSATMRSFSASSSLAGRAAPRVWPWMSRCSRLRPSFGSVAWWKNSRGPTPSGSSARPRCARSSSVRPDARSSALLAVPPSPRAGSRTPRPRSARGFVDRPRRR